MKTAHGLIIFDYKGGPDPSLPNIYAFGFMQTEDRDRGLDITSHAIKGYEIAQIAAHQHWQKHLTFRIVDNQPYEEQHVFAYSPEALIHNLFKWGTDLNKFDPTLPKEP